jgi:hypothetical protein
VKKVISVFFFVIVTVCLQAQNLTWNLKFLKGAESVSVSRIIQMETGQPFQFTITPDLNSYCYVILYDSDRKIEVYHSKQLNNSVIFGPWSLGGTPGTDIFYVIMSLERQDRLESLIETYNRSRSAQNTENLHKEIINLQNKVSEPGEPPGIFIAGGGTTRGDEYINHFTGKNLYVRPINLRH